MFDGTIESVHNERLKTWMKLKTAKGRKAAGAFLVEGPHLVQEALGASAVTDVMIGERALEAAWAAPLLEQVEALRTTSRLRASGQRPPLLWRLSAAAAGRLAETESPQAVYAVVRRPDARAVLEGALSSAHSALILDAVQDPGNVGTLIRSADAFGVGFVLVGTGSADPWSGKVLRSAQGAHFHLPIAHLPLPSALAALRRAGYALYAAAPRGPLDIEAAPKAERRALIVGNEGRGLTDDVLAFADYVVRIDIPGRAESLNVAVAASIALYVLSRKKG
ncbi:MAG: RNA methyltransferase [Hydrogenibacillus sp.]|nr:RNA methyltransferase [Hydrogenibacillus sp.]